jgi:hypothetical protein
MKKVIILSSLFFTLLSFSNNNVYTCTICEMQFKEKGWAEKCQNWCKTENSCNEGITKHAIAKND